MTTSAAISQEILGLIKFAARELKGLKKRLFMSEVANTLCHGSPRLTESEFGWNRNSVQLGLNEQRIGLECFAHYDVCGKRRSEVDNPELEEDIRSLVEPETKLILNLKIHLLTPESLQKRFVRN